MRLLDANLDVRLNELLTSPGIKSDTAENGGGKALCNGDLVAAEAEAGFATLLTRNQLFDESVSRAWQQFPNLSVIVARAWDASPVLPEPGKLVIWP